MWRLLRTRGAEGGDFWGHVEQRVETAKDGWSRMRLELYGVGVSIGNTCPSYYELL